MIPRGSSSERLTRNEIFPATQTAGRMRDRQGCSTLVLILEVKVQKLDATSGIQGFKAIWKFYYLQLHTKKYNIRALFGYKKILFFHDKKCEACCFKIETKLSLPQCTSDFRSLTPLLVQLIYYRSCGDIFDIGVGKIKAILLRLSSVVQSCVLLYRCVWYEDQ